MALNTGWTRRWRTAPVAAAVVLLAAACGGTGGGQENADGRPTVQLTLLTAQDRNAVEHEGLWMFVEALEQRAPWIEVDYRGGPEVVAPLDMFSAVANGAFDMVNITPGYYTNIVPGAYALLVRTQEPLEERDNGSFDIIQELHEPAGIYHLGTTICCHGFQLYFGPRGGEIDPNNLSLEGLTVRSPATYLPTVTAYGAPTVNMPFGEVYNALDRGIIDGTGGGSIGMYQLGVVPVLDYELRPEFLMNTYCLCVNLAKWNSLDEETKQALTDTMLEIEGMIPEYHRSKVADEQARRGADGVQPINLSPAEAERFVQTAYDATWEDAIAADPNTSRLRELWDREPQ